LHIQTIMSNSEKKPSSTCQICCDDFTSSTRACITCSLCNLEQCRECVRKYLLNTTQQPHCMGCKNTWDRQFLINATLRAFVNGDYRNHRAQLLLEQEKARLPETMPAVENYLKISGLKKEIVSDKIEYDRLQINLYKMKRMMDNKKRNIRAFAQGTSGVTNEKKREFKQKCGVENCLGFLSSAWKCGLCETWTCPHCFEVLGKEKECGHECDPNNVESAKLIKKETRNCPSCATPIFKIEGCDQMWCTQCHIAFSWKSGLQVNGVVHNPHFYQWQRNGGGTAPIQTPGAQACGGLPGAWQFRRQLNRVMTDDPHEWTDMTRAVMRLHAGCAHFQHWELDRIRRDCQKAADNTSLRIQYLCKELTEKKLKQKLQQQDKKKEKKLAQLHIYELINTIFLESLNDIQQLLLEENVTKNKTEETCLRNLERCHKVRVYANTQLAKISGIYSQNVGLIDNHFRSKSCKIHLGTELKNPIFTEVPSPLFTE